MGSEVEVTFYRKKKRKKCFRWSAFMINYISACKSQMTFMDFEAHKLRTKAELRIMMAQM